MKRKVRYVRIYKDWCVFTKCEGSGFFGFNFLLFPAISITKRESVFGKKWIDIGIGWLKWGYSFSIMNTK